jgi:hypothetical protein
VQPGTTGVIAADRKGRVLLAQDNRLMMWDQDVVQIAQLGQRIIRIAPIEADVLLELADHSMVRTALAPGSPVIPLVAASNQAPLVSGDGHLIVGHAVNDQVVVVEAAARAAWICPPYYASSELMTISPTTRRFVQAGYGRLALWTLPVAPPELRTWLDERINAVTNSEHALAWPWQLAPRP